MLFFTDVLVAFKLPDTFIPHQYIANVILFTMQFLLVLFLFHRCVHVC